MRARTWRRLERQESRRSSSRSSSWAATRYRVRTLPHVRSVVTWRDFLAAYIEHRAVTRSLTSGSVEPQQDPQIAWCVINRDRTGRLRVDLLRRNLQLA